MTTEERDELATWPTWKVCALAFVAMCANDIVLTAMVIFEAGYNGWKAGLGDILGFLTGLVCNVVSIDTIRRGGWFSRRTLAIIGSISAANFIGTLSGVAIAAAVTHHH